VDYKILISYKNSYKLAMIVLAGCIVGLIFSYIFPSRTIVIGTVDYEIQNSFNISLINLKRYVDSSRYKEILAEELSDPELPIRFDPNIGGRLSTDYDKNSASLIISISEDSPEKSELELRKIVQDIQIKFNEHKSLAISQIENSTTNYNNLGEDVKKIELDTLRTIVNYYFYSLNKSKQIEAIDNFKNQIILTNPPMLVSINRPSFSIYFRTLKFTFIFGVLFLLIGVWWVLLLDFNLRNKTLEKIVP